MKKIKTLLASLCIGTFLFSAIPSLVSGGPPHHPQPGGPLSVEICNKSIYEERAERISNFLKDIHKLSSTPVIPSVEYGYGLSDDNKYGLSGLEVDSHVVCLYYKPSKGGLYLIGSNKKEGLTIFLTPGLVLFDDKENKYGRLDGVYARTKGGYRQVDLHDGEKEFINHFLYQGIIDKFYLEHKEKIIELENLLKVRKWG